MIAKSKKGLEKMKMKINEECEKWGSHMNVNNAINFWTGVNKVDLNQNNNSKLGNWDHYRYFVLKIYGDGRDSQEL